MSSNETRFFVAYEMRDAAGDPATGQPTTGESLSAPHFLPIPEDDVTVNAADPADREGWFDLLRLEGAIAARIVQGEIVDERLFIPDESLPPVYMVTSPEFGGSVPYTATIAELEQMFPACRFIDSTAGVLRIDRLTGPSYIGIPVRTWRERIAASGEPVPVVYEGEPVPNDRTYVFLSEIRRAYRHDPDRDDVPRMWVMERSCDVIPYVDGKPLWAYVLIDFFASFGEERAVVAAREAIAIARGVRHYEAYEHFERFRARLDSSEDL